MHGPSKERLRVASKTWRAKIDSHESIHHDSLDSLGYDWDRVADPGIANDAYRYMHSRTVKDPERRSRIDPNARHALRRAAAEGDVS